MRREWSSSPPVRRRALLIGGSAAIGAAGVALVAEARRSRPDAAQAPVAIGILTGGYLEEHVEAFREGLRDHGWTAGQNITILHRDVGSEIALLPAKAEGLAALGVRVIVVTGPASAVAVTTARPSIPVVMAGNFDPVRAGVIVSFAEPGTNVTGVVTSVGLDGKRVEFLKQLVPASERLALITNLGIAGQEERAAAIAADATTLELHLRVFDVRSASQIAPAFDAARDWGAHLLMPNTGNPMANARSQVIGLAARLRVAAIYPNLDWVRAGGLAGLAPELGVMYRRAAWYVDRIIRGASPAQLPVERSSVFELLVHRKALVDLGLTIPPSLTPLITGWVY